MRTWYTSDLHFGHNQVALARGFPDVTTHDGYVIESWSSSVGPKDTVYVLGDVALKADPYVFRLIYRLPGTKHLIAGNHDAVHPMHRRSHNVQREWLTVFESVQAFARKRIAGQDVLLSHFPYSGDHTVEDRCTQYRLPDLGGWLLHGHTHGPERRHGRQVHVGLDAWGLGPVSEQEIEALMNERGDV